MVEQTQTIRRLFMGLALKRLNFASWSMNGFPSSLSFPFIQCIFKDLVEDWLFFKFLLIYKSKTPSPASQSHKIKLLTTENHLKKYLYKIRSLKNWCFYMAFPWNFFLNPFLLKWKPCFHLIPLKTSENFWFSWCFRRDQNGTLGRKELNTFRVIH